MPIPPSTAEAAAMRAEVRLVVRRERADTGVPPLRLLHRAHTFNFKSENQGFRACAEHVLAFQVQRHIENGASPAESSPEAARRQQHDAGYAEHSADDDGDDRDPRHGLHLLHQVLHRPRLDEHLARRLGEARAVLGADADDVAGVGLRGGRKSGAP